MTRDDEQRLRDLLQQVRSGQRSVDDAIASLRADPRGADRAAAELGFATVDHDRARRCGFPEVVFCQGKTPDDTATIAVEILSRAERVLLTRAEPAHAAAVIERVPAARYHARAHCITAGTPPPPSGHVAVVAAGTADLPVAEEAAVTLEIAGNRVERFTDIGVAGLHRLLAKIDAIRAANVIVAVAGMEGALPSVVAGLVDRPVVAVPTSVGYGANFGGLTALLSMLNSCAAGVAVVNIDNGFGAGYLASQINLRTTPRDAPRSREPHE
ncbi:MAG: nickel pincer cofactor biosynthesis protein LarB [Planctomycetes bacterium]|nr:nickel pincer cofactor biosynthesis protein LarB [Planctomycetota bacterium]